MNFYDVTVPIFDRALGNLDQWIEAAAEFAKRDVGSPTNGCRFATPPTSWIFLGRFVSRAKLQSTPARK